MVETKHLTYSNLGFEGSQKATQICVIQLEIQTLKSIKQREIQSTIAREGCIQSIIPVFLTKQNDN